MRCMVMSVVFGMLVRLAGGFGVRQFIRTGSPVVANVGKRADADQRADDELKKRMGAQPRFRKIA